MRALSLILALGVPLVAGASFDMMLIPSHNTNAVHRYDPINNISLGSFPTLVGNITSVAAVAGASGAVVNGGTGTQVINYDTGQRISSGSNPTGFCVLDSTGNNWFEGSVLGNRRRGTVNPLAVTSGSITTGMTSGSSIVLSNPTNVILLGRNSAGDIVLVGGNPFSTSPFPAATIAVAAADVLAASQPGQLAMFTVAGNLKCGFVYRSIASGTYRLITFSINADGTLPGTLSTNFTSLPSLFDTTNAATTVAVVAGHDGAFAVGVDSTGAGTRIVELGGSLGINTGNSYLNSNVTAPIGRRWHMANVVAPEPGTMAALGLGVAALLRGRKQ